MNRLDVWREKRGQAGFAGPEIGGVVGDEEVHVFNAQTAEQSAEPGLDMVVGTVTGTGAQKPAGGNDKGGPLVAEHGAGRGDALVHP